MSEQPTTAGADEIEVGEVPSDGLRLWRAREALRQGEVRLAAQAAALASLEGRAQAMVGWAAAATTVLAGAFLAPGVDVPLRVAAMVTLAGMVVALASGARALWPGDWRVAGHDPTEVLDSAEDAELYVLEAMAGGYSRGVKVNAARLASAGRALTTGLIAMGCAPVAGWLAGFISWASAG